MLIISVMSINYQVNHDYNAIFIWVSDGGKILSDPIMGKKKMKTNPGFTYTTYETDN